VKESSIDARTQGIHGGRNGKSDWTPIEIDLPPQLHPRLRLRRLDFGFFTCTAIDILAFDQYCDRDNDAASPCRHQSMHPMATPRYEKYPAIAISDLFAPL